MQLGVLLGPELVIKRVARQGLGVCEPQPQPPVTPPFNFSPILRNPVDHINATVGELLVFKVPDVSDNHAPQGPIRIKSIICRTHFMIRKT